MCLFFFFFFLKFTLTLVPQAEWKYKGAATFQFYNQMRSGDRLVLSRYLRVLGEEKIGYLLW